MTVRLAVKWKSSCCIWAGGRANKQNMTKVAVTFRNLANASKNGNKNNFGFTMPSLCVWAFAL